MTGIARARFQRRTRSQCTSRAVECRTSGPPWCLTIRCRDAMQRSVEIRDARWRRILRIVGKYIEEVSTHDAGTSRHRRPQVGLAGSDDREVRHQNKITTWRRFEKRLEVNVRQRRFRAANCAGESRVAAAAPIGTVQLMGHATIGLPDNGDVHREKTSRRTPGQRVSSSSIERQDAMREVDGRMRAFGA
jgi:hypothetical protein